MPLSGCRICGGSTFESIIDLGWQYLTGVFPRNTERDGVSGGPLHLVRCAAEDGCGLVQLEGSFEPAAMYGANYGYRSGLNPSMVRHLERRIRAVQRVITMNDSDVVVDIGSNDGTSLGFYPPVLTRVGVDPTADKFRAFYPSGVRIVPDFFSEEPVLQATNGRKARVITAFSMLYDLEYPVDFLGHVASLLSDDGLFVFEQSYLPLMLDRVAFDTICHEHVEYYGMRQIDWMLERVGLEAIDVELNDVNGGSFAITAAHRGAMQVGATVSELRAKEAHLWSSPDSEFRTFASGARAAADALSSFIRAERAAGRSIAGLGASTKGNVLLQFAGITSSDLSVIGDVNPDKFGAFTPGSWIPITSESNALDQHHDGYVVLPWHYRDFFVDSPVLRGRRLVFPLPKLEIVQL